MRKSFTRLFTIMVFLSLWCMVGFSQGYPDPYVPATGGYLVASGGLNPADNSTATVLPGTGNTFVMQFTRKIKRLLPDGVISLNRYPGTGGLNQQEPIRIGNDLTGKIKIVGTNKVSVNFAFNLLEGETYYITVTNDAIEFEDDINPSTLDIFSGLYFRSTLVGFDAMADWGFTVKDMTPPALKASCTVPLSGSYDVALNQAVTLCFTEPVYWAAGVDPAQLAEGDIAFYQAANTNLGPTGGNAIHDDFNFAFNVDHTQLTITPKSNSALKAASITTGQSFGTAPGNFWDSNMDVYLHVANGLLVDWTGNAFAGITGNPIDGNIGAKEYWFTTRSSTAIVRDIKAYEDGTSNLRVLPLWKKDDFKVSIQATDLTFITGGAAVTKDNASQFITIEEVGSPNVAQPFTVTDVSIVGNNTIISLNPADFKDGKDYKVTILGGKLRNGSLVTVGMFTKTFSAGDYSAPVITTTFNNILCTNFDFRVETANENGVVYYALVEDPAKKGYTHWYEAPVTYKEILQGYHYVWSDLNGDGIKTANENFYYPFNTKGDDYLAGITFDPVTQLWSGAGFTSDKFDIVKNQIAYEHVTNFILPNDGDTYKFYYFAVDPDAQGPYTAGLTDASLTGQATAVNNPPQSLTFTDCKAPVVSWLFKGVNITPPNPLFDACGAAERIQKLGQWKLHFTTPGTEEPLQFVNSNDTWLDVLKLEVSTDAGLSWNQVEIASAVYASNELLVTPVNSYPSGGLSRITVLSGSIQDEASNAINTEISCQADVEIYSDPAITKFVVNGHQTKFVENPNFVVEDNSTITIEFNNPMFTPQRDETVVGHLLPISETNTAVNWIGNYIKLREGTATGATVASNIAGDIPLTYAVTRAANGGITKVVVSHVAPFKSELFYYVELEQELLDENRVMIATNHNNTFTNQFGVTLANPSGSINGTATLADDYGITFKSEDTIAPQLVFFFKQKNIVATKYAGINEDITNAVAAANNVVAGALITEWAAMGFDHQEGYDPTDPNSLRPYFTLTGPNGPVAFDVVRLDINSVDLHHTWVDDPSITDYVVFGFVPFAPLTDGSTYTVTLNPDYKADPSFTEGPVFVDDNNNKLTVDTSCKFTMWSAVDPSCLAVNNLSPTGLVLSDVTPSVAIKFDRQVDPIGPIYYNILEVTTAVGDVPVGGGDNYNLAVTTGFGYGNDFSVTMPYASLVPLKGDTYYKITVPAGAFKDRNNAALTNCLKSWVVKTKDLTAPTAIYTPDIAPGVTGNSINPRNSVTLKMVWSEAVTPVVGKTVELWENGTTLRKTFTLFANNYDAATKTVTFTIDADFLRYNSTYHVSVDDGLVVDLAGNPSAGIDGNVTGLTTWTFNTAGNAPVAVSDVIPGAPAGSPAEIIDPYLSATSDKYEVISVGGVSKVKLKQLTIVMSEKVQIANAAAKISTEVFNLPNTYQDVAQTPITSFTTTDGITWKANVNIVLSLGDTYDWIIPQGTFVATDNAADFNGVYTNDLDYSFADITAPTVKLWPENPAPATGLAKDNLHIPFNSHLYARFSESMIGSNGTVLTSANLKNWVKMFQGAVQLPANQYVVEFIDNARTRIRVTPLDPDAPAFNGTTASMEAETVYSLQVLSVGTDGEILRDAAGNNLTGATSTFTTEDITPPVITLLTTTANATQVTSNFTVSEPGTISYIVLRQDQTSPTVDQLLGGGLTGVKTKVVAAGGPLTVSDVYTVGPNEDYYTYKVVAAMVDDEVDVYTPANNYAAAWIGTDVVLQSNDYPVNIRDIRPAPNASIATVVSNVVMCDNDAPNILTTANTSPMVNGLGYNGKVNVPKNATFTIRFDESVILTPGAPAVPPVPPVVPGYEIRLRKWENNISVPITWSATGTDVTIVPSAPLDDQTKYYIEIDRMAIKDISGCSTNYFAGWVGRDQWNFTTEDKTGPKLYAVTPLGNCVAKNAPLELFFEDVNGVKNTSFAAHDDNFIYIYKASEYPVPYEVIGSGAYTKTLVGNNKYKLTFATAHTFNSEEQYIVAWKQGLFVDESANNNPYYENVAEVTSITAGYDSYSFRAKDYKLPVALWTVYNTNWATEYVVAQGIYDPNDPLAAPYTITSDIPHKLRFEVQWLEDVNYAKTTGGTPVVPIYQQNFFLKTAASNVTMDYSNYAATNVVGATTYFDQVKMIPHGNTLTGSTNYEFGVSANNVTDVNDFGLLPADCSLNTITNDITLFKFKVWNTEAPILTIYNGDEQVITGNASTCNAEGPYIRLAFDKDVVKTLDNVFPLPPGAPWWTYENLKIAPADLMATNHGAFIDFRDMTTGEAVALSSVEIVDAYKSWKLFPAQPLNSEHVYQITFMPNVVKDVVRVPDGNIFAGRVQNFTIRDWEAPYVASAAGAALLIPKDEATAVDPTKRFEITFNEQIQLGTGNIIVRDNGIPKGIIAIINAQGSVINGITYPVTLSVDKKTVYIEHPVLDKNRTYYVQIEPGFVKDLGCGFLPYAGVIEFGIVGDFWNFSTGDSDSPTASLQPFHQDDVSIRQDLIMTFNKNVNLTSLGNINIYTATPGSLTTFGELFETIDLSNANYPQIKISGTDAANGLTANRITVTPSKQFVSKATYYVRVVGKGTNTAESEASPINDVNGNAWFGSSALPTMPGIHDNYWWFTIADHTAPVLVSKTPLLPTVVPAGDAQAVTNLTMTFSNEVKFGAGQVEIFEFVQNTRAGVAKQSLPVITFTVPQDVTNGKITLSSDKKTVTINNVTLKDGINWYYVLVQPGTITSNVQGAYTYWEGIQDPDVWRFATAPDVTSPTLTSKLAQSTAVDAVYFDPSNVSFTLTFSENVGVKNATLPLVSLYKNGVSVSTMTILPSMITNNVVKFNISNFTPAIVDKATYSVVIGATAIHDLASASVYDRMPLAPNFFGGIADGDFTFSTGDFTAPVAIAASFSPNAINTVENTFVLSATFSEDVIDGPGLFKVYKVGGTTPVLTLNAANDENLDPKIVDFTVTLPEETQYYVVIESGAVTDKAYLTSTEPLRGNVAVTNPAAWAFEVDDNTVPAISEDLTVGKSNLMKNFTISLKYNDQLTSVVAAKAHLLNGNLEVNAVQSAVISATDASIVNITVAVPTDMTTYTLSLDAGFVKDNAHIANSSEAVANAGSYTIGDRTAPVATVTPASMLPSYIGLKLIMTFTDKSVVSLVSGSNIQIMKDGLPVETVNFTVENNVATFTPSLVRFGAYSVNIPAGSFKDANGNLFAGYEHGEWSFSVIDNTKPDLVAINSLSPADGTPDVAIRPDLTMTFTEKVVAGPGMVKVYELDASNTNQLYFASPVTSANISGNVVKIPALKDLKDGNAYTVLVDNDAIYDEAGNNFVGIYDPTRWNFTAGDNTAPTLVITDDQTNDQKAKQDILVTLTFTEKSGIVLGVENAVSVVGGTKTITKVSDLVYTVAIKAADIADVSLTVSTAVTDKDSRNHLAAAQTVTFKVGDNTAPTLEVTAPAIPVAKTFTVGLKFSETVTGVSASTITVTRGTLNSVTGSGAEYTLSITGAEKDIVGINIPNTIADLSGNLFAGKPLEYTIGDFTAPVVTAVPSSGDNLKKNFSVVLTFSDDAIVTTSDITATGGTIVVNPIVGNVCKVDVTANDLSTVVLSVASTVADAAGNKIAGTISFTYKVGDNTAPTLTITGPASPVETTFIVSFKFSEIVTGFSKTALTITNGTIKQVVGSGTDYLVSVSAAEKAVVTIGVTDAIVDANGNKFAGKSASFTVGDFSAPLVTVAPIAPPVPTVFTIDLKFDENVSGLLYGGSAVTVTNGKIVDITGKNDTYKIIVSAKEMTNVKVTLTDAITDLVGNKFAGLDLNYTTGDFTAPQLVAWTPTIDDVLANNHPTFKMTFSENVKLGAGNLVVYKVNTSTPVLTIPITDAMIAGKVVTVDYATTNGLDKNARYYVFVDATALTDIAGNAFEGVSDAAAWTFKTGNAWITKIDPNSSLEFKVYPNPFVDFVNVDNASQLSKVVVTNIAGQVVKEVITPASRIQLNELRSGIYFMSLYNTDNVIVKTAKIVKR